MTVHKTISNSQHTWALAAGAPETPRPFAGDLVADVGKLLSDTRDLMSQLGGGAIDTPSLNPKPRMRLCTTRYVIHVMTQCSGAAPIPAATG